MIFERYSEQMIRLLHERNWDDVLELATAIQEIWNTGGQLLICGNGGSAGNAVHLANDFLYGVVKDTASRGIRVEALSANPAVITCLANDIGYEEIYSVQIAVYGNKVNIAQFTGLSDVFYVESEYSTFMYMSGQFNDPNKASSHKNDLIKKGYKDAFVLILSK